MSNKCFVHTCTKENTFEGQKVSLHKLPSDPELKNVWLDAIKRDRDESYTKYNAVCSIHFHPRDIIKFKKRNILRKGAIPTLHLPASFNIQSKKKHHFQSETTSATTSEEANLETPTTSTSYEIINKDKKEYHIFKKPSSASPSSSSSSSTSKRLLANIPFPSFEVTLPYTADHQEDPASDSSNRCPSMSSNSTSSSIKRERKRIKLMHSYSESPSCRMLHKKALAEKNKSFRSFKKIKMKQVRRLKTRITHFKEVINDLKKKHLLSTNALTDLEKTLSGIPLVFMKRMLINVRRNRASRAQYPEELKAFALTLHFYSGKAYEYVRKTFHYCLPAPSVIRSWYSNINCMPGYTIQSLDLLKEKQTEFTKNGQKLLCSLMLDEMAIKKKVEIVGSKVYGYVDLGSGLDDDEVAQEALVLMVVAVNANWKLPIAYFLIKSLTGAEKASIVRETLGRLYENNTTIVSVTCDGPSAHFSMFNDLGCKLQSTRTIDDMQFWFKHPSDPNLKVFAILDVSHMLKLIRNMFCKLGILKNSNGEEIKWVFITKLFEIQQEQQLNLANKLKLKHIKWEKQKMKVSLAAQTLSNSVAEAIQYLAEDEKLLFFQDAGPTIEFIKLIDGLFDYLNSRNPFGKGTKSPLRVANERIIRPFLENCIMYLSNLTDVQGKILMRSQKRVPLIGFITSIKSFLGIFDMYVKPANSPLKYLLTYRFSQDHLELYFCWVRSRNGWNNNPTAFQFTSTYKRLLVHHDVRKVTGNCVPVDATSILTIPLTSRKNQQTINVSDINILRKYEMEFEYIEESIPEIPNCPGLSGIAENVVAYISGFTVRMAKKKIKCETCLDALEEDVSDAVDDTHVKLLVRKNKGGLIRPSKSVFKICELYEIHIRKMLYITGNKLPPEDSYKATLVHFITSTCLVNPNIFSKLKNHVFDLAVDEELHRKKLTELIGECYLKIRMFYIGKLFTEKITGELLRKQFSKLILFHHQ